MFRGDWSDSEEENEGTGPVQEVATDEKIEEIREKHKILTEQRKKFLLEQKNIDSKQNQVAGDGDDGNSKPCVTIWKEFVRPEGSRPPAVRRRPRREPQPEEINSRKLEKDKFKFRIDARDIRILGDVLRDRGWHQVEGESSAWDLFWCDLAQMKEAMDKRLNKNQRLPHFRNFYELARKNHLSRNLQRYKKLLLKEGRKEEAAMCDCVPTTFELPSEYMLFLEYYRNHPHMTWIVKPAIGSQGRGIFLFKRLKDLNEWRLNKDWSGKEVIVDGEKEIQPEAWVIQAYVENPYLIAGKKFDLRIYVLVMSFNPLKVWICRDAFARFCGSRFDLSDLRNTHAHLTNTHIQLSKSLDSARKGCKWSMKHFRQYLTARHGWRATHNMIQDIAKVIITSLSCVQKCIINSIHCFELYGYDIIIDADLKPHLLEINSSPSLCATDEKDYQLKYNLLLDTINILDLEGQMDGSELRVGGFDLVWDGGPIAMPVPAASELGPMTSKTDPPLNVFLGCVNDRAANLAQLASLKTYLKGPRSAAAKAAINNALAPKAH